MMRRALAALLALATLALAGACTADRAPASSAPFGVTVFEPGQRSNAPTIRAPLLDGTGEFDLADHAGDVVVVNFWASWCGPCVAEAADLEQTYQATKARGVTFLGVNTRGDDRDAAQAFVARHKPSYPNVFDPAGAVAMSFTQVPPTNVPSTIVLDRQGNVAAVAYGAVLQSTLEPVVAQLAAESG